MNKKIYLKNFITGFFIFVSCWILTKIVTLRWLDCEYHEHSCSDCFTNSCYMDSTIISFIFAIGAVLVFSYFVKKSRRKEDKVEK